LKFHAHLNRSDTQIIHHAQSSEPQLAAHREKSSRPVCFRIDFILKHVQLNHIQNPARPNQTFLTKR